MKKDSDKIVKSFELAKARYQHYGVDVEKAMKSFDTIPVSVNSWAGDDVRGFEHLDGVVSQNVVTGNYPGAARNGNELRSDIDAAFNMSPVKPRVNLSSMHAEPQSKKSRNEFGPEDFKHWVDWAKEQGYGLDFNTAFYTHPMIIDGFTLSSRNKEVRDYWIQAGKNGREIAAFFGKSTGIPSSHTVWVPDGLKDIPANRLIYRQNLKDSLDQIFKKKYPKTQMSDFMEGKVFGIGTECYTVGSHDFYLAYAAKNNLGICMDTGHYHPTETAIDKVSSECLFIDNFIFHVSRGVRWDSDHTVIQSDELNSLMLEIKRADLFPKVIIGLDFFDATINRVAAWVIGLRSTGKAILRALLEPTHLLEGAELEGDYTSRLILTDEFQSLPVSAVWDMICLNKGVAPGSEWLSELKEYEKTVQSKRL